MGTTKDTKKLVKQLKKRKIPVNPSSRHLIVICPNGQSVTIAKTPSDWRSIRNTKADLKRNGVNLTTDKRAA